MVSLGREKPDTEFLEIPCGGCMACKEAKAKEWMLRCQLEMSQHKKAAFTTLTYRNEELPPCLSKKHLQTFLKRLRDKLARQTPARTIRFFAAGEYGEQATKRPHYHAILYGASEEDAQLIQEAWPHGHTLTVNATPATISYTAGYTAKKLGDREKAKHERIDDAWGEQGVGKPMVDKATGEFLGYYWQPPFLQMSLKPGIGAHAKKFTNSWRMKAVHNGKTQPVPRYYHEEYKKHATNEDKERLADEKRQLLNQIRQTPEQRKAAAAIMMKRLEMKAGKRKQ